MSDSIPQGFYRDSNGQLQKDRRQTSYDRRSKHNSHYDGDRRNLRRRKTDFALQEREAEQQIKDALETFAVEHEK